MSECKATVTVTWVDVSFDRDGKEVRAEDTIVMTPEEWLDGCRRVARAAAAAPPPEIIMVAPEMIRDLMDNNAFLRAMGKKP